MLLGRARRAGSTEFESLGPEFGEKRISARGGVHNSGVWGLKLAKSVLPVPLLERGPPRGGVDHSGSFRA